MIIFGGIVWCILFILLFISILIETWDFIVRWMLFVLFTLCSVLLFIEIGSKEAYCNALAGKNPYKMEIRYELKDSTYVPVDTIYVKIK